MTVCSILIERLHAGEKSETRLFLSADGQKVELRRFTLLTVSSGLYTPSSDGITFPISDVPDLLAAFHTALAQSEAGGGGAA